MPAPATSQPLALIQGRSLNARMEEHSFTDMADTQDSTNPVLCNWEAIAQLEEERKKLGMGWVVVATVMLTAAMTVPLVAPGTAGGFAALKWTEWRSAKVSRLLKTMKLLLDQFELKGVEIYPKIPIEGMYPIDLFIRFPKQAHLIVSIRSKGDTEIVYNEVTEEVRVRKKNRTTNRWHPNPLVELADQERWIAKNRWQFGMSVKEASKTPTAKVLALCSPTKADEHRKELYSEVGTLKPLAIRRKGTAFVIQEEELADFVAAWLAKYE